MLKNTYKPNYASSYFDSKYSVNEVISRHRINPSLSEVVVSTIANQLFPNNFPQYKFLKTATHFNVDAGYKLTEHKAECGVNPIGVEAVYATSLFLGLKIKSHFCIEKDGSTYLSVDDVSRSLHQIDTKKGGLVDEYRGSKDSGSTQMLFPTEFLNKNCGEWLALGCNTTKLKEAYHHIIDTVSEMPINSIFENAKKAAKAVVYNHNTQSDSVNLQEVDQFFDHLTNENLNTTVNNYITLLGLSEDM